MPWTTPKTWSAGETLTAANFNTHIRDNLNAIGPTIARARTTADVSNATTTLANLTGISFAIGASEIWVMELHGFVNIDATGDYKSNWSVPSGATGHHWTNAATLGGARDALTTSIVVGATGSGDYPLDEYATVVNSTTAGTVQFQFALNSASGSTTWRANAHMIAHRIS
jgi:hypothetical protein